jgi:P-type Cu2+ transporter
VTAALAHACAHCSLPVPAGRDGDFCCAGCEVVHGAIAEYGLDKFYALRETSDAQPAHASLRSYAELDDPAFQRLHVNTDVAARAHAALYVEDLRCTACVWLIESTPRCIAGVEEMRVDLGRSRVDVSWDPAKTSLAAIARHLDRVGHAVHPYKGLDRDRQRRREDRVLLLKLGVAGAAVGNLMLLAIALYCGLFQGMSGADTTFFRWASMLIAVPALGYAATPMFRTAIGALRAHRLHLDLPLSIGIVAGLVWGTANVLRGVGEIYFDSLAMLIFLLLVARWIVLRHQRRASTAAELLLALTPSRARRVTAAGIEEVPIEAIVIGDVVEVRAGETIPVDGRIARGTSTIDTGLLTGESRPIDVTLGSTVNAGTVNLSAPIEVVALGVGETTRVGGLVASIEALSARKAPIERLVDRIAARFVPVVTLASLLTFVAWSLISSPNVGAEHAMALLIVTCPCALALATPLAVTVALGRAARRGILIKGADALERLATPGTMFVDKTGTLTQGRLAVTSWHGDVDARGHAAALEVSSAHPIARAIAAAAEPAGVATEVNEQLGQGIRGVVAGRRVCVGSPSWVRKQCPHTRGDVVGWIDDVARLAQTPIAIALDGTIVAIAGLADPIRSDAKVALRALAELGWRIELLSGDDPRVVHASVASLESRRSAAPETRRPSSSYRSSSGIAASARLQWSVTASTMQLRSQLRRAVSPCPARQRCRSMQRTCIYASNRSRASPPRLRAPRQRW